MLLPILCPGLTLDHSQTRTVVLALQSARAAARTIPALDDHPEIVNQDPYGEGWMLRIRVADAGELDDLLDSAGYTEHIG